MDIGLKQFNTHNLSNMPYTYIKNVRPNFNFDCSSPSPLPPSPSILLLTYVLKPVRRPSLSLGASWLANVLGFKEVCMRLLILVFPKKVPASVFFLFLLHSFLFFNQPLERYVALTLWPYLEPTVFTSPPLICMVIPGHKRRHKTPQRIFTSDDYIFLREIIEFVGPKACPPVRSMPRWHPWMSHLWCGGEAQCMKPLDPGLTMVRWPCSMPWPWPTHQRLITGSHRPKKGSLPVLHAFRFTFTCENPTKALKT